MFLVMSSDMNCVSSKSFSVSKYPHLQALLAAKDLDRGPRRLSRDVRPQLEAAARGAGYRLLGRQRDGAVVCWCGG